MQNQTRLLLRGSTYYLRVKVPRDLRDFLKQKWEITRSLGTKDRREAEVRARIESVKLDEHFAALRREQTTPLRTEITDAEIAQLSAGLLASMLGADEEARRDGQSEWERFRREARRQAPTASPSAKALSEGDFSGIASGVEDWLIGHGFRLQPGSEDYRKFAYAFAKAHAMATEGKEARDKGKPVDTPVAVPLPYGGHKAASLASKGGPTILDLYAYWEGQSDRKARTAQEFKLSVDRFHGLHPKLTAKEITKSHCVAFKDHLLALGLARGTITKQLGAVSTVFQTAADNDKIPFNPARGVRLPKHKVQQKARTSFDDADLKRIFGSPVYVSGERPTAGAGEAAYWLPLLAHCTGARLGEVGQLRTGDVKQEGTGAAAVPYFSITNEAEGGSIKTESSRRRVPIHEALIRLGFLEYVEERRKDSAASDRLFPELRPNAVGVLTANFSKWFGRYLRREIGIKETRKTFHSFRHSFKDICREAGIDREVHDALTGHASGDNEGSRYGGDVYPMGPLAKAIRKIKFDRVPQAGG